ncbi:efflux transporter outer membrane subunit [Billgrantia endophytica]|uniref:efflux transporter outer membrane subunit n=1 Tax=Billgrantia endophytica TaxID=2033802 RepID=UPI00197A8F23|nr:efflux transporter outer membrane subunit [Halomonas endophytica]
MTSLRIPLLSLGLSLMLAACSGLPAVPEPPVGATAPETWEHAGEQASAAWPEPGWWRAFGSGELEALIRRAEDNSPDLAAAAARLRQAEAQARIAGVALLPGVDAGLEAGRSGVVGQGGGSENYGLSLGASYETDFWGGNRARRDAAEASLLASAYDRETVALTLTAGVANAYLQLLSLRERLEIAELNLALAEEVLRVVEARVDSGAAAPLDLARQRGQVARQRGAMQPLRQQEREAVAALALLLGEPAQQVRVSTQLVDLEVPAVIAGLPSELLVRRPDIRREEARLAAAVADIAAARADFFPSLRLTGSLGTRSEQFVELLSGDTLYGLAASLTRPVFDGGRLRAQGELSEARYEELLAQYRGTTLQAFSEVDLALAGIESLALQAEQQERELDETLRAFVMAETRYREGADDLLSLLEAQQSLYQAQENTGLLRLARLQALVGLYRALGGGWNETA